MGVVGQRGGWREHPELDVFGAYEQKVECDSARTRAQALERENREATKASVRVVFHCLPDTIDPRGPKVK